MARKISDNEKIIIHKFLEFYSECPICKNKIQKNSLIDFYFKTDPDSINLKKKLLKLMKQSENFDGKIIVGIPCCFCYGKIFPGKKIVHSFEINERHYPFLSSYEIEQMLSELFE